MTQTVKTHDWGIYTRRIKSKKLTSVCSRTKDFCTWRTDGVDGITYTYADWTTDKWVICNKVTYDDWCIQWIDLNNKII